MRISRLPLAALVLFVVALFGANAARADARLGAHLGALPSTNAMVHKAGVYVSIGVRPYYGYRYYRPRYYYRRYYYPRYYYPRRVYRRRYYYPYRWRRRYYRGYYPRRWGYYRYRYW